MSEALLFLSRRGLGGILASSTVPSRIDMETGSTISNEAQANVNERFLSSVSAFIRRCFEYADPDHPKILKTKSEKNLTVDENIFGLADDSDEEDDLLDLGLEKKEKKDMVANSDYVTSPSEEDLSDVPTSRKASVAANAALNPSKPLHITLPTFRMVVLADELLEQFFESSFPASFYISESLTSPGLSRPYSSLTTFSNIGSFRNSAGVGFNDSISAGVVPPGKGLRGVLDNIVTDGMRVAAEVRRRMDESQKDLDSGALSRKDDDDDDDDGGFEGSRINGKYGDAERRSVRSEDRDLLEGADAEAGSPKLCEEVCNTSKSLLTSESGPSSSVDPNEPMNGIPAMQYLVEFER